jgi:hypothetical protein
MLPLPLHMHMLLSLDGSDASRDVHSGSREHCSQVDKNSLTQQIEVVDGKAIFAARKNTIAGLAGSWDMYCLQPFKTPTHDNAYLKAATTHDLTGKVPCHAV